MKSYQFSRFIEYKSHMLTKLISRWLKNNNINHNINISNIGFHVIRVRLVEKRDNIFIHFENSKPHISLHDPSWGKRIILYPEDPGVFKQLLEWINAI